MVCMSLLNKFKVDEEYIFSIQSNQPSPEVFLFSSITENPDRMVTFLVDKDNPYDFLKASVVKELSVLKHSRIVEMFRDGRNVYQFKIYKLPPYRSEIYKKGELILIHNLNSPTVKSLETAIGIDLE